MHREDEEDTCDGDSCDQLLVDRLVLEDIIAHFEGKLALNADVIRPGTIDVGDPVRLVRPTD